jgi:hypothetical protein
MALPNCIRLVYKVIYPNSNFIRIYIFLLSHILDQSQQRGVDHLIYIYIYPSKMAAVNYVLIMIRIYILHFSKVPLKYLLCMGTALPEFFMIHIYFIMMKLYGPCILSLWCIHLVNWAQFRTCFLY